MIMEYLKLINHEQEQKQKELEENWKFLFGRRILYGGIEYIVIGIRLESQPPKYNLEKYNMTYTIQYTENLIIASGLNKLETIPLGVFLRLEK